MTLSGRKREAREIAEVIGRQIADALGAVCLPPLHPSMSVSVMGGVGVLTMSQVRSGTTTTAALRASGAPAIDVDVLVKDLFEQEGRSLVRLVRLFVDDRNAAEDLVQEGFIRLAHNAHRITDRSKAAAYLRSIVLNLARDHNRRGLVSLRHHLPTDEERASTEDEIVLRADQREVVEALRALTPRQRDCLVLRYYHECGIDDIAGSYGISRNSVKTHLKRGLVAMEKRLGAPHPENEVDRRRL
jgi:RNA polymerase sigma factor (sigma-70 family)